LSQLVRGAAILAIEDGTEQITRDLLDAIPVDYAAQRTATPPRQRRQPFGEVLELIGYLGAAAGGEVEVVDFVDFTDRDCPNRTSDLCLCVDYMFAMKDTARHAGPASGAGQSTHRRPRGGVLRLAPAAEKAAAQVTLTWWASSRGGRTGVTGRNGSVGSQHRSVLAAV